MGVARIDTLTPDQSARIDEWADRWIAVGLRTGRADRERFEAAMRDCYGFAGLEWPGAVVWVPSPLVLALAARPGLPLHRSVRDDRLRPGPEDPAFARGSDCGRR